MQGANATSRKGWCTSIAWGIDRTTSRKLESCSGDVNVPRVTTMLHGDARSRMSSFWAEKWMSMRISQNLEHYISSRLTNLVKPKPIWVGVPNIMFGDNMWFDIRIIVIYSPLDWLINFYKMHFSPHSWEGIHKNSYSFSQCVFKWKLLAWMSLKLNMVRLPLNA